MTTANANDRVLPECGHKDYMLGCERCFTEMRVLVQGDAVVRTEEASLSGAVLYTWHLLMVIGELQQKCQVMTRSLDLQHQLVGHEIAATLTNISAYMIALIQRPTELQAVLRESAALAAQVEQRAKQEAPPTAPTPPTAKSSLVITDAA